MQFAPLALIFLLIIVVFVLLVWLIPVRLWIAAWSSGARVGFGELIGMRLRRVSPGAVVNPRIAAVKAGLDAPTNILESHYLAGGNVDRVVNSLISADKAGIALDFSQAAAIDLVAGEGEAGPPDPIEAVDLSAGHHPEGQQTVHDGPERPLGHAVDQEIPAGVEEDRAPQPVAPVVVVGEPAQ